MHQAMPQAWLNAQQQLKDQPRTWLITGVAGFIGSHLLERLLGLGQTVVGLDNFATGHAHNLAQVQARVGPEAWRRFTFQQGDIRVLADCQQACQGVDHVLHQAALGSVPRSVGDPLASNETNVNGFLHMLVAARDAKVRRFVFAASSSTYGDHPDLPKVEDRIGRPLSPYAVTKYVNELYADVFARTYGLSSIGLRYFNVFGPRQDPNGAYAAVIPRWIDAMLNGQAVNINGDGSTSRDFCFVDNVVQCNVLAALSQTPGADNTIYNVAAGQQTSLNDLQRKMVALLPAEMAAAVPAPVHRDFRVGDVKHSLADITKAQSRLGYRHTHDVDEGLAITVAWHLAQRGLAAGVC